jgi:hypothetical protein
LDGRLSLIVRPLEPEWNDGANREFTGWHAERTGKREWLLVGGMGIGATIRVGFAAGDRIWGREAYALNPAVQRPRRIDNVLYQVDAPEHEPQSDALTIERIRWVQAREMKWRPDDEMPPWASRLTLIVNDVAVKQIHRISPKEACATGVDPVHMVPGGPYGNPSDGWLDYGEGFKRQYQDVWDRNLWCAFYSVTVHPTNIDGEEGR